MTTIAWDGKTLAADRGMVSRGVYSPTTKIVVCDEPKNGWPPGAFAGSGNLAYLTRYAEWIQDAGTMPSCPEADIDEQCGLYVTMFGGICYMVTKRGVIIPSESPFEADGSGFEFALACMICGKTAAEAIELTAIHTQHASMGVQTWTPR